MKNSSRFGAVGVRGGRLAVRHLDVHVAAGGEELARAREHRDRLGHVLEHLVERDEVEAPEVRRLHEVGAHRLDAGRGAGVLDGPRVRVERGADPAAPPSCAAGKTASPLPTSRTVPALPEPLTDARDALDVVGALGRQRHDPLVGARDPVGAVGGVDVLARVELAQVDRGARPGSARTRRSGRYSRSVLARARARTASRPAAARRSGRRGSSVRPAAHRAAHATSAGEDRLARPARRACSVLPTSTVLLARREPVARAQPD